MSRHRRQQKARQRASEARAAEDKAAHERALAQAYALSAEGQAEARKVFAAARERARAVARIQAQALVRAGRMRFR